MRILTVNPGSSSMKMALVSDGQVVESTTQGVDDIDAWAWVLTDWAPFDAVGVRVVHGGARHTAPVLVDETVLADLDRVADLAPLHNPPALQAVRVVRSTDSRIPVVAAFDTTFHQTMAPDATTYPLPAEWNRRWHLRRYGFHGLSHEQCSRRAAALLHLPEDTLRTVTCHIGAGASLCAVVGGRSVDTTMGFTPLAGLVMQVRAGSVDPGLLLWLQRHQGMSVEELDDALERRGGLRGLSGTSGDLREVLVGRSRGDEACTLAWNVYVHRLVREVGGMVASAGGIDVLAFTGGVGENCELLRSEVAHRLAYTGAVLDGDANERMTGDREISGAGSLVRMAVLRAREELGIAAAVETVLHGELSGSSGW